MRRLVLLPLLVAAAGLSSGCPNDRLKKTLPPDVRVDTYSQQSASKIDVLWVVDNSGSMASRQQNLARNFGSFIDVFTRNAVNFRIGVTTTDIFKDAGRLRGNPQVIRNDTPNLAAAFGNNIKVGTDGSPYEAGLEAAALAIDRQQSLNKPAMDQVASCKEACNSDGNPPACVERCYEQTPIAFLRPDAYWYIIFVTDEEDRSSSDIRFYWRKYETANGVGNDGTVTTAAIIGDVPTNGCSATPGVRYKSLTELTGGELGSICDTEFATTLQKLATSAVGLKRKFALGIKPNIETLEIRIVYPCNIQQDRLAGCQSVDRTACDVAGTPAESYNLICTPPQGGADGWTYEAAQNAIFFAGNSVPGVNAHIELQYYEEGKP